MDAAIIRKRFIDESDSFGFGSPEGRRYIWTKETLDWVFNEAGRLTRIPNAFMVKSEILVNVSVLGNFIKVSILLVNQMKLYLNINNSVKITFVKTM